MRAFRHIGAWYGGTWLLSYGGRGRPLGALLLSLGGLPLTGGPEFSVVLVSVLEIADLRRAPRPLHSAIVKRPLTPVNQSFLQWIGRLPRDESLHGSVQLHPSIPNATSLE